MYETVYERSAAAQRHLLLPPPSLVRLCLLPAEASDLTLGMTRRPTASLVQLTSCSKAGYGKYDRSLRRNLFT
uniref:Uncharacterized protein n=1 Tax=Knipowitschia caucasica TaxID=637954 RepID=A0AAV2KUG5_KNICA